MPRVHSARNRDEFEVILNSLEKNRGKKARWIAELTSLWALRISDLLALTTAQIDESFKKGEIKVIEALHYGAIPVFSEFGGYMDFWRGAPDRVRH